MEYFFCLIAAVLLNFFAVPSTISAYYLSTKDVHQNPPDAFLAGEKTPVWVASSNPDGTVTYKKLEENFVGNVVKKFLAGKRESGESSGSFESDSSSKSSSSESSSSKSSSSKSSSSKSGSSESSSSESGSSESSSSESGSNDVAEPKPNGAHGSGHRHHHKIHRKGHGRTHRRKAAAYDTIYPSILVVTDYKETNSSNHENEYADDILYQLAFWNSVDLHFRDLESPKVRLRIAGIVLGEGRAAQPYMNKFINESDIVSSPNGALQAAKTYWGELASNPNFNRHGYDVIITITDVVLGGNEKHGHPLGLSAQSSLCTHLNRKRYQPVGIICDRLKFGGVLTATHELGHIFGTHHDPPNNGNCSKDIGYIMTPSRSHTDHMHQWSPCSKAEMKKFLGQGKQCAAAPADYHDPGKPIPRIAPGDLLTADQQCDAFGFTEACHAPQPDMCTKLHCAEQRPRGLLCHHVFTGAQDGTSCAKDAICVHGECLEGSRIVK